MEDFDPIGMLVDSREAVNNIEREAVSDGLREMIGRLQDYAVRLDNIRDTKLAEQVRFGVLSLSEVRDTLGFMVGE